MNKTKLWTKEFAISTSINFLVALNFYLLMIITSEFSPTTWIDFDEGTGSRLIHRCKDRIIKFEGRELNHRL